MRTHTIIDSPIGALTVVVPCHRVVGSDGTLTGFAGGLARKQFLLDLEGMVARDVTLV